ncbi:MAG TPA: beta-N-acetylhexosaminidase [Bryobacteraceae bacterium]|jgi:hexosaminidase|nr:beta-N-acetylhexosaminidase [Bryobacteraceae bacterium]
MTRAVLPVFLVITAAQAGALRPLPIVPRPAVVRHLNGTFLLGRSAVIYADPEAQAVAAWFAQQVQAEFGIAAELATQPPRGKAFRFVLDRSLPEEGYRMRIDPRGIVIAGRPAGLFYGAQSVLQLAAAHSGTTFILPAAEIQDQPRFSYRGLHLDTSRHMFPVEFIKHYLDWMARYKLNTFHWHLTDDQGWRIEIRQYPRLAEIASMRKETLVGHAPQSTQYDGKPYGGFYTQEQIREVVAYARDRFITVIPEIEMPGHSLAALAAYPELACTPGPFETATTWGVFKDVFCPKESTFQFLENVLSEVLTLFPSPYIHIGGDEVQKDRWKESPDAQAVIRREGLKDEGELQSYFIRRMERFINSQGRRMIGWDEILEGGLAPDATVMSWRGEQGGIAAARQGHDVIMSPDAYLYFDHYQGDRAKEPLAIGGMLPLEKVYSYNPLPAALNPEEQKHILGAQANMWTEYIQDPRQAEYMLFPRLFALAEVVWSPQSSRNYRDFLSRVPPQLARLKRQGVNYRPLSRLK